MRACSADVIGLDWAVDIADARATFGQQRTIQVLFTLLPVQGVIHVAHG